MKRLRYFTGFVPWLVFGVFDSHHVREAAIAALVVALAVGVRALRSAGPRIVELSSVVAFTALTVIALVPGEVSTTLLSRYARVVPATTLAIATLATLLRTPLIEQYARRAAAPEIAAADGFRRRTRSYTQMWSAILIAMAGSHVVAGVLATPQANRLFNWTLPIALTMLGVRRMRRGAGATAARRSIQVTA